MRRREFSRDVRAEIIRRATTETGITCETCSATGLKAKQFHVDHSVATGLITDKKTLRAADGTVMCLACHKSKTALDVGVIVKAKNMEARHLGITPPKQKIQSRGFGGKAPKPKRSDTVKGLPRLLPKELFK